MPPKCCSANDLRIQWLKIVILSSCGFVGQQELADLGWLGWGISAPDLSSSSWDLWAQAGPRQWQQRSQRAKANAQEFQALGHITQANVPLANAGHVAKHAIRMWKCKWRGSREGGRVAQTLCPMRRDTVGSPASLGSDPTLSLCSRETLERSLWTTGYLSLK